jgi:hypothetical protein
MLSQKTVAKLRMVSSSQKNTKRQLVSQWRIQGPPDILKKVRPDICQTSLSRHKMAADRVVLVSDLFAKTSKVVSLKGISSNTMPARH